MITATIIDLEGNKDWVNPVINISITEDEIIITNGCYDYPYSLVEVKEVILTKE